MGEEWVGGSCSCPLESFRPLKHVYGVVLSEMHIVSQQHLCSRKIQLGYGVLTIQTKKLDLLSSSSPHSCCCFFRVFSFSLVGLHLDLMSSHIRGCRIVGHPQNLFVAHCFFF